MPNTALSRAWWSFPLADGAHHKKPHSPTHPISSGEKLPFKMISSETHQFDKANLEWARFYLVFIIADNVIFSSIMKSK